LKKAYLFLLGIALLLSILPASAFADDSQLHNAVNEVVGTPYKWGGTTTKGFDCSGFILHIFNQYDIKLPRTSKSQSNVGEKVGKDELRPGDLVFFNTSGKGVSHAGIYLGDGEFAHSSSKRGVSISKLSDSYYKTRYVTARRVASGEQYEDMSGNEQDDDDVPVK